jgi:hypothetical protein
VSGWVEDIFGDKVPEIPLTEIAIHEAAHAVVAAHLEIWAIWVQIDPVKGRGEMTPETPWNPITPRQRLLIAQAGSAAQCRLNGSAAEWTIHGAKDRVELEDFLADHRSDLDPNDFAEIDRLLENPVIWRKVEKLAQALLARNRIEIPALRDFL